MLMLEQAMIFLQLRNLLLQRVDQAIAVLNVGLISISFRDSLMSLSLLLLTLELELLQIFLLGLVSELGPFEVRL